MIYRQHLTKMLASYACMSPINLFYILGTIIFIDLLQGFTIVSLPLARHFARGWCCAYLNSANLHVYKSYLIENTGKGILPQVNRHYIGKTHYDWRY